MTAQVATGIWLYGLAGSGKSYASKAIASERINAFVIDGDEVRERISSDLGYTSNDRAIQINRLLGIGQLAIKNNCYPVISSVYMTDKIFNQAVEVGIKVLRISRDKSQLKQTRSIYKYETNVVGKDIDMPRVNADIVINAGDSKFIQSVLQHVK